MERRDYVRAIATIMLGSAAGCTSTAAEDETMTEEEARETFDSIKEFESPFDVPLDEGEDQDDVVAKRFVDSEAGVVFWGVEAARFRGGGIGLTSMKLEDTDLEEE